MILLASCGKGPGSKSVGGKPAEEIPKVPRIQSVTDGNNTYFISNGGSVHLDSGNGQVTIEGSVEASVDKVTSNDLVGTVEFDATNHLFSLKTTILYGETRTITFLSFAGTASDSTGASVTIAYAPIIKMPQLSNTTIAIEKVATGSTTTSLKHFSVTTLGSFGGATSTGATGYQLLTGPTMLMMGAQ